VNLLVFQVAIAVDKPLILLVLLFLIHLLHLRVLLGALRLLIILMAIADREARIIPVVTAVTAPPQVDAPRKIRRVIEQVPRQVGGDRRKIGAHQVDVPLTGHVVRHHHVCPML